MFTLHVRIHLGLLFLASCLIALARAEDTGPCAEALRKNAVCGSANVYANERIAETKLEAMIVMQDVPTGALAVCAASNPATFDITTALRPLSPVKLMTAASWLEHGGAARPENERLLTDSIVNGNDNAGRQIASAVRKAVGTEKVLEDLARFGFPASKNGGAKTDESFWAGRATAWLTINVPEATYHSLGQETTDNDWDDTLSLGEQRFITTAVHLSRFLQAIGNGGVMVAPVALDESTVPPSTIGASTQVMSDPTARKLQEVMRRTVERGTAKSAKPILAGTGWTMGGKTGTGPDPNSKTAGPGPGSDGCFAGLIFDPKGKARFTVVTFVKHGGFGGGNAARISAEVARYLIGKGS
jgi:Penicillin binding protein transpeptidase domain